VPLRVLLAVGLDSALLESQRSVWQTAGYHVTSADSIREGIAQFHEGDFDLVLLSHSIPSESRERLAYLIRASGSRIPVICVSESSSGSDSLADATIRSGPENLLQGIEDLLSKQEGRLAARQPNKNV
jgi:DNA-binding response OmpR family regulator